MSILNFTPAEVAAAEAATLAWEQRPNQYRSLRANAYPPIGDQLDAIWKGGDAEVAMREMVLAVKAQYPKP